MDKVCKLHLSKLGSLFVRHARIIVLDLEKPIDLLKRQTRRFDEKVPDNGKEAKVDNPKHHVELPPEVGDAVWRNLIMLE